MLFANPIWLLALVPWLGLALWMLWGRRERVGVPFLALWRDGEARPKTSRAVQPPPLAVVLILLAILLAVLAASSPVISRPGRSLTVLVDRGMTMSAREEGAYRYARAASVLALQKQRPIDDKLRVVVVPHAPERVTDWNGLERVIESIPPTAVDTSAEVEQAAMRLLATSDDHVLVLTDQENGVSDSRLIVVSPTSTPPNVGIAHVAARDEPVAQVMVRVGNKSPATQAKLVVSSDGQRVERTIDLPPTTREATAFIDLPRLGRTVEVALAEGDALSADDRAWLVRESGWPRIEPIATLPAELARMVETYRKLRPPRDDAPVVSIVDAANGAAGEAVLLAPVAAASGGATPTVVEHPVTTGVAWPEVLRDARLGAVAPAGFTPVVSVGDRVAVAVRQTPARQVRVALDAPPFPRSPDYVVFWTNVFDWLGRGSDAFVSHPVGLLGPSWQRVTDGPEATEPGLWPGIYQRRDGNVLRAVNAPRAKLPVPPIKEDWRERLARLSSVAPGGRALSPYLLLAALACALGAALLWPAARRRPST